MIHRLFLAAGLFLAAFAGPAYAQDGRSGFCVDYANEAVEMQRRNLALGCGIEGLRWHEWWDGHYGWCKDWVPASEVRHHTELRRTEISRCEDRLGSRSNRYPDRRRERRSYD